MLFSIHTLTPLPSFCSCFFETSRMLDDMEDSLDKATSNLNFVTLKTKELIKKSGGKKNFLIIVSLTLVVIFLFMLILYT